MSWHAINHRLTIHVFIILPVLHVWYFLGTKKLDTPEYRTFFSVQNLAKKGIAFLRKYGSESFQILWSRPPEVGILLQQLAFGLSPPPSLSPPHRSCPTSLQFFGESSIFLRKFSKLSSKVTLPHLSYEVYDACCLVLFSPHTLKFTQQLKLDLHYN